MKLWVWGNVNTDYSSGGAVAIAETYEEAVAAVLADGKRFEGVLGDGCEENDLRYNGHPFEWAKVEPNEPKVIEISGPVGFDELQHDACVRREAVFSGLRVDGRSSCSQFGRYQSVRRIAQCQAHNKAPGCPGEQAKQETPSFS